ncbi:hypothetical protein, partial [Polynucleobacter sp. 39-46-10]|uniref:hypothetical protein n=1 Tax=Polynucleobacter sp. 39-46-10 TaxID=1970428 RepID=UPI000BC48B90
MKIDDFLDSPQSNNQRAEAGRIDNFLGEPAPKPSAFKENSQDAAAALLKIFPTAAKGVADIAQLVTGGKYGGEFSGLMQKGMDTIDKGIGSQKLNDQKAAFNAVMNDPNKGLKDLAIAAMDNPRSSIDAGVTTLGSMILPAGVARGAIALAPTAAKMAAATGATIGTNAIQNAADTFTSIDSPELIDKYKGAGISGLASLLIAPLTGGGAEGAIARKMAGEKSANGAIAVINKILGVTAKEGGQEAGEEIGNYIGEAVGNKTEINSNQLLKRGAYGGALGAMLGGGTGAITQIGGKQLPETIQDGANVTVSPAPAEFDNAQPIPINPIQGDPSVSVQPGVDPIAALSTLIADTATQASPLATASTPTVDQFLDQPAAPTQAPQDIPAVSQQDAFLDASVNAAKPSGLEIPQIPGNQPINNVVSQDVIDLPPAEPNAPTTMQQAQAAIPGSAIDPINPSTIQKAQAAIPEPINEPAFIDLDKHSQLQAPKPGMRIGDIVFKNGSVFKTRKAAQDVAKKAGKGWVSAPSNQGFVVRFRPQTDKQLAATAKRVAKQREVTAKDSMLQAISKLGGINSDELVKDWGVSLADLGNKGSGVFRVATKAGVSADRMASSLKELGFISQDESGKHDLAEMMDLFMEEARGGRKTYANAEGSGIEDQYSQYQNDGYDEWIAAKDAKEAELNKLGEEAQTLIGEWVGSDYQRTKEEDAEFEREIAQWEQSGESQDRIPEFNNDAIDATNDNPLRRGASLAQDDGRIDSQPAGEDRGDQSVNETASSAGEKQSPVRPTGAGSQRNAQESFSLESQTEATLKAAEEAKAAAEKAKQEADRAAEARAQADAEVGQFNLTGSDRAADVAAAQGQQDLLGSSNAKTDVGLAAEVARLALEIGNIRKGKDDRYASTADPILSGEMKLQEYAEANPALAKQVADELDANPEKYSEASNVPEFGLKQYASILNKRLDTIAARIVDKAPIKASDKPSDIKDFGEKIGGARKDVWNLYGDNLEAATELDAADVPFAKAWPEPNYQKLIEAGADPKTVA